MAGAVLSSVVAPRVAHAQASAPRPGGDARPTTAATTAAQATEARAQAAREFQLGLRMLDEQRFAEAVAALERSIALRQSATALYNLGLAYRGVGNTRRAIETFEAFRALVPAGDSVAHDAEVLITELRRSLVRLEVRGPRSRVTLDGAALALTDGRAVVELDPGRHVVEAQRPGHEGVRVERELAAGERVELDVDAMARPRPAQVRIETNVADAEVRIDGRVVGRGNYRGGVAAGRHELEVRAAGRPTERRVLELEPDEHERVAVTLPSPPSLLANRWLWVGVGAAVVGIVVGVAVGTSRLGYYCGDWGCYFPKPGAP